MHGRVIDSVGILPGRTEIGGTGTPAYPTRGFYHVRHNRLYFGMGDRHEVRVYRFEIEPGVSDPAGMRLSNPEKRLASMFMERIVRRAPDSSRAVTPAIIEARKEAAREGARKMQQRLGSGIQINVDRQAEMLAFPDSLPAQARVTVDSEGNIWEQRYNMPGDSLDTFAIFDVTGVWLGNLAMPPRFRFTDIGADYVAGIWRDEFDVEYVRLYRLVKPRRR
jgi:hypothetical protein